MAYNVLRNVKTFVGDFETTVYEGQESTEVWASACVELFTEDVKIFHSIKEQFNYFISLRSNIICYYHNLKFDGYFWLYYLLYTLRLKQAIMQTGEKNTDLKWLSNKDMQNNTFKYTISDRGQWYLFTIKIKNKIIELRDSVKLLPFSVKSIGKCFGTKHKKLSIEYKGFRYSGCKITDEEKKYIANDVLVVKEALEIMFKDGHNSLTIGSCCMKEFKKMCIYYDNFVNLYDIELDKELYGSSNVDEYIRKSYKGGWCYLVEGKENKIYTDGLTADVNSLYPSVMSSESGNRYPIGKPIFWSGNYIEPKALKKNAYYFIRVKTRFYLKENMLPFIQIKNSFLYDGTKNLKTSDIYDYETGEYVSHYIDEKGNYITHRVELTLTMSEYELLIKHYYLFDFEILDGCYFYAAVGIFDAYIDKYKKIKMQSTGAVKTEAKLFLNNLYGKLSASTNSSFKYAYINEEKESNISYLAVPENEKTPGYIACGTAVTGYARQFTIRAAQNNYHGVNNPGFIYSDTDSIHCDLKPDDLIDIPVDDVNFCRWKLESFWKQAIFVRQKTYIEYVTHENGEEIEPFYSIKCAGMPEKCKKLFELSMSDKEIKKEDFNEKEIEFLFDSDGKKIKRGMLDFKKGLTVPGKLLPKRIPGGIILTETEYRIR